MKTSIHNLKAKGFVTLDYPSALRKSVERTVGSWKDFCDLSEKVKKGLPYSNNADGVGYELKDGVGNKADRKENFDLALSGRDWLDKNIVALKDPAAVRFVNDVTELIGIINPVIVEFARQVEKTFNISGFADEVEGSAGGFFVRFIHYFGNRKTGEETASAHVDQSGFTLHLFESHRGLQCLTYDKKWIDMPVSSGETVIIPAMQMQLRSKGELKALTHRVIANAETARSGRYSAVCFVQLKNTPKYDKDKHGRLQEKAPGFNYDMPHSEFSKLFKE